MRRFGFFLLWLLTASLLTTATVHAREIPGAPAIECSGFIHSEGDADQSQGDADKAMPHHHGNCHGASVSVPADTENGLRVQPHQTLRFALEASVRARWSTGPDLRPPIA